MRIGIKEVRYVKDYCVRLGLDIVGSSHRPGGVGYRHDYRVYTPDGKWITDIYGDSRNAYFKLKGVADAWEARGNYDIRKFGED